MQINVIGLGYIGLPTTLMLAAHGNDVVGTDQNAELVGRLNAGQVTFKEDGLEDLFFCAVKGGVSFTTEYRRADVYIIAVPTPYDKSSKKIDATYVINAFRSVQDACDDGAVIVIESTIAPGTIDKYIRPLVKKRINLAHAPERIIPGKMIYELEHNARTIGADDPAVGARIKAIYKTFCKGDIVVTDNRTAEMSKVVENTYRDINIAFANELTKICHSAGLDVYEIIRIANMHPRVNILSPGPGVGGHCISVDPWFLVGDYPGLANLILTARRTNDGMPKHVIRRIRDIMRENNITDASRVGLYGLTYKENVDDVRESPTLQLLERLDNSLAGGLVQVYDPWVKKKIAKNQRDSLEEFLDAVDIVVIMVGHDQIIQNAEKLAGKIVFDTRNVMPIEGKYHL